MTKKIDIGKNAKVIVKWNVCPSDFSKELEKSAISLMAEKYEIPEKNISVEPNFLIKSDNGIASVSDSVKNIHDPKFQQELFKIYMQEKGIDDIDFEEIVKIDSQINSLIDYNVYNKSKRYSIKWVKWGNFLSYGPDNFFDFTSLSGLILLSGEPANKSGKSTFAYDLLHFLLFGKTNTNKAKTLGDLFNNYLPDEKNVTVEGCITIDGCDYKIKRTLTRPSKEKKSKTITNKVEYYKILENGDEQILSEENLQGETTTETSKIIKDALGNENDFDLIISANAKDLDSLISLTETEKGRLLSRWIGLSVIEDKDSKAREKWNKEISVGRFSDIYNKEQLLIDIKSLEDNNDELVNKINIDKNKISDSDNKIKEFRENRDILVSTRQQIDESILKIDSNTLQASINSLIECGKRNKSSLESIENELNKFCDIDYSEDEYRSVKSENDSLTYKMAEFRAEIKSLTATNENLLNAEFCPTCHRKLDGVDNSDTILKNKERIEYLKQEGILMCERSNELSKKINEIDEKRKLQSEKSKLELKKASINSTIAEQRIEYKEKTDLLKNIEKNKDAISKNSEINAKINVIDANIRNEESVKSNAQYEISSCEKEISKNNNDISIKKSYILKIDEERKTEKNWKLYLQMIGKDGISKMVLKNTLPLINGELNRLLTDVSDFKVEIVMNEKNDIDFLLIRDNVVTRLSAASGLEKTQAALALRVVLGSMSRLSRPPFILLDEVLGTVARENYDDMKKLYDKITEYYDFILHITHITDIADWHKTTVIVKKENNISSIK